MNTPDRIHQLELRVAELEQANARLEADAARRIGLERKLRESEPRSLAIVENATVGIYLTSEEGDVLYTNNAVQKLLGRPDPDDLLGRSWINFVHPEDREIARLSCERRVLEKTADEPTEYRLVSLTGSEHLVSVQARPLFEGERLIGFVGTILDVTQQRRDDEARSRLEAELRHAQKLEAVGTLAGGIAHDFNNILGAIIGNVELARQDVDAGHPVQQCLDEIFKASVRARNLISQILAFSRKQQQEKQVIPLKPIVDETVALIRSTLPSNIELEVSVDPDTPPILADPTEIHQVLTNLATNAWQSMEGRGGRLTLQVSRLLVDRETPPLPTRLPSGEYARISVTDTGAGIRPEVVGRIFEPFFTTKAAGQGTGLGLSVVHGIVRSHSGTIAVASEPGRGSTFHVCFPAATLPRHPGAPERVESRSPVPFGGGRRILFLDDEEQLVFLATRFLEKIGYKVSGFAEPAEAIAALQRAPQDFEIAVTDMSMPGMNGLKVAEALIRIRPDLPIVLASGNVSDSLRAEAHAVGVQEIFYKPDSVEELCRTIHSLIQVSSRAAR
jgi:PAS domain S-box-containing protein